VAGVTLNGVIRANKMVSICVKSRFNNFIEKLDYCVLPRITQNLPQHFMPIQSVSMPKHIKLADPNFNVPASVDILIGAEFFWRLICAGQIKQSKEQPTIQKIHFGWIISDITQDITTSVSSLSLHLTSLDELTIFDFGTSNTTAFLTHPLQKKGSVKNHSCKA